MHRLSTKGRPATATRRCVLRRWLGIAGLAALLCNGCGRPGTSTDSDPERNPYFQRAKKSYELQDFQAAAGFYQKALQVEPQLARAHLELGLLYDEKLSDPIAAIYHYREFLDLEPKSDKRQLVEDFIERAKLSLASKLPQSSVVDPADMTRLQTEKAALMQENGTLRARIAELERGAASASAPAIPPVAPAAVVAASPSTAVNAAAAPAENVKARTHTVQKGDTLQSLALKYYGTRSAWDKIYQVNRSLLASKDQLKIGQQLLIP